MKRHDNRGHEKMTELPKKRLHSFREASSLLSVSEKTLRRWDADEKIKTVMLGTRHKRIPDDEIERISKNGIAA